VRFTVDYPITASGFAAEFLQPSTVSRIASVLEQLGFDALAFTDHPAPSKKWLDSGGHESFDPLTALAFCAATTTRLRLMTYLLVLPYRNPLLAAKQIATVDVLSGGRLVTTVGGGYLRSEFAALGVDFDERNELFDEALQVLNALWASAEFTFEGRHFQALGQASRPATVQRPRPPVWIGGNSRRARERVAAYADGWAPMMIDRRLARTTRTGAIESVEALADALRDLRSLVEQAGRDPADIDVQVQWHAASRIDTDPAEALAFVEQLAQVGVTWLALNPPGDDVERCVDLLAAYADNVIGPASG
jgi:probable F420-dependent oxidoreductase